MGGRGRGGVAKGVKGASAACQPARHHSVGKEILSCNRPSNGRLRVLDDIGSTLKRYWAWSRRNKTHWTYNLNGVCRFDLKARRTACLLQREEPLREKEKLKNDGNTGGRHRSGRGYR
jgi:hypothetical protein